MHDIGQRKQDHLDLCSTDEVAFRERTNLLECVQLVHQSLPELALEDIDLGVELFGKRLRAPIIIASMTGGNEAAAEVNQALSAIAEARGYGFGLGSQRAMQRSPESAWTYEVRSHAPTALLLGNVGIVQARDTPTDDVAKLVADVGADALCLHMNPAQEMIQPGGDRNFRGCVEAFARFAKDLPVPVLAKETGNGISRQVAGRLRQAGVSAIDVSGAGGTSWVGVETLRAEGRTRTMGEGLWDWGIPTAAAVAYAHQAGHRVIATGGMARGLDIARAIALGADAAGFARPVLMAYKAGGAEAATAFLEDVERELATVMLLLGARRLQDLRTTPRVITGELQDWLR
ncbi:MAG: type 2 isopentenyl-diphosphate Delta-isomerase [Myxococcales bacterium]|nr:type 2 isopentenyl-diphosphate Delta-isomerase [Myxococcales bacterium]MDD9967130.1 type 2 isopentenyl-diphosphate Delta-isomerase [Myxococcales bacterium]